ncbi:unnamed protein product, partial [Owenia fusiformis]
MEYLTQRIFVYFLLCFVPIFAKANPVGTTLDKIVEMKPVNALVRLPELEASTPGRDDHPFDEFTTPQMAAILEKLNLTRGRLQGDIVLNRQEMIDLLLRLETIENAPHNKDTVGKDGHITQPHFKRPNVRKILNLFKLKQQRSLARTQRETVTRYRRSLANKEKWTFPISYFIDSSISPNSKKEMIRDSLDHWEEKTCASFREVSMTTSPGITFTSKTGCVSSVGMVLDNDGNEISLENGRCNQMGVIVHEVGHALGFYHTQTRPDRDSYVILYNNNIQTSKFEANYAKDTWDNFILYNLEYDYASVMHYSPQTFSITSTKENPTMDAVNPLYNGVMGNDAGLSFLDAKLFNIHYCSAECPGYS